MSTCSISHVKCPGTAQEQMDLYSIHQMISVDCKNNSDESKIHKLGDMRVGTVGAYVF